MNREKKVERKNIGGTIDIELIDWLRRQQINRQCRSFSEVLEQVIRERKESLENTN